MRKGHKVIVGAWYLLKPMTGKWGTYLPTASQGSDGSQKGRWLRYAAKLSSLSPLCWRELITASGRSMKRRSGSTSAGERTVTESDKIKSTAFLRLPCIQRSFLSASRPPCASSASTARAPAPPSSSPRPVRYPSLSLFPSPQPASSQLTFVLSFSHFPCQAARPLHFRFP